MDMLSRFQIIGLYGTRNVNIAIENNTIIFVGENGMGKTTVLRFMCAVLSGAFHQLPSYKFTKIIVTISGRDYEILRNDVTDYNMEDISQILNNVPAPIRRELMESLKKNNAINTADIVRAAQKIGYPMERIIDKFMSSEQLSIIENQSHPFNKISRALGANILYLPTYRRIEEDLSNVIKGRYSFSKESNENRYRYNDIIKINVNGYIELVEFGMQDVKDKIEEKCSELSRFSEGRFKDLAYMNLGDVIEKNYISNKNELPVTEQEIQQFKLCLSRNSKAMLSETQINSLIQTVTCGEIDKHDTHMQILLYYFRNLLSLQSDLENKEKSIIVFCDMCNKYLSSSDKIVVYDISTFKLRIIRQRKNESDIIDMSDLSSGEKQIVSLFSHLFLTEGKEYLVIIDEPELSLSVPWQKTFLNDIRKSSLCRGIIAATHSPFIYDNDLFPYTHSLGEYIEEEE